jgi:hemoglobin-like flavoprotein
MTADDRRRVACSIRRLRAAGALGMDTLYARLFAVAPETRALFIGDMGLQMSRFWTVLERVAQNGVAPESERLLALGWRHADLGVEDIDHAALCTALIDTLAETLGPDWTEADEAAWRRVYRATALAMSGILVGGERLELPTSSV